VSLATFSSQSETFFLFFSLVVVFVMDEVLILFLGLDVGLSSSDILSFLFGVLDVYSTGAPMDFDPPNLIYALIVHLMFSLTT